MKRNLNRNLNLTSPNSPIIEQENIVHVRDENGPTADNNNPVPQRQPCDSPASLRGRNKIRRNQSKLYKENQHLKLENEKLRKKYEKYKKKQQRCVKRLAETENMTQNKMTTNEKYKTLSNAIKERYKSLKQRKEKMVIKSVFDKIDQSTQKEIAKDVLGSSRKLRTMTNLRASGTALRKKIQDFYKRDDISRATAGRKETVTKKQIKEQKRFLLDTILNIYRTFKRENPETKCSYFYFAQNRPFYVVKPSVDGRDMCLCKSHVNPVYKAHELKKKQIIHTADLNSLILSTVCDQERQACMYGICEDCCDKKIIQDTKINTEEISWTEWGRREEVYKKEGKSMKAVKNVKETKKGTVEQLMEAFNKEVKVLKKHVFNMKMQYRCFRQAVDNLKKTEVVLVADFSENYNGKYHEEVQAHHFGGSREQISLHTVVSYILDSNGKVQAESFCTISSCTNHQPAAIWAHLQPVLSEIRYKYPKIDTIHFFTDGPFNQYRQKQNFYLCSTKSFDHGFSLVTWTFFEAGHGKGPADGIGGFLKRTADNMVATGKDIPNAEKFFEILNGQSKIKLFIISVQDIESVAKQLPKTIKPLIGTLHVHQVYTDVRGELMYRDLGCFCNRGFCDCFQPKKYKPINVIDNKRSKKTTGDSQEGKGESDCTSEDDLPLSTIQSNPKGDIDFTDLCKNRVKSVYDIIYSQNSDNEEQPGPSRNKAALCIGDFLLVKVPNTKGKLYRYLCVIDDLDDDGEIRVTFMRCVKKGMMFRLDSNDIAYIDYIDIIAVIKDTPVTETKRGQIYYTFKEVIDVFEK